MHKFSFLASHWFWQLLALLPAVAIVAKSVALHRATNDPGGMAITVGLQIITWLVNIVPCLFFAMAFRRLNKDGDADARVIAWLLIAASILLLWIGYSFWGRFFYPIIFE